MICELLSRVVGGQTEKLFWEKTFEKVNAISVGILRRTGIKIYMILFSAGLNTLRVIYGSRTTGNTISGLIHK